MREEGEGEAEEEEGREVEVTFFLGSGSTLLLHSSWSVKKAISGSKNSKNPIFFKIKT